ncbi:MAG: hypothetical protein GKR90_19460 [Pseudomonadales bacterium]|nr:hypothetical protein [Pseudomonadales bacterium]
MNQEIKIRARSSILGAVVADAASLGFHWVYSQRRISDLAPTDPVFRTPDARDYEGGVGYFAHEHKQAGDLSQYGEQMIVMLRSLADNLGRYEKVQYTEAFRRHFGYGGGFVGYIDRPTRQTLDRIYRDEHEAIEAVDAIPYDGPSKDQQSMLTKVLAAVKQYDGIALRDRVEWYANQMPDPKNSRVYGLALVEALSASDEYPGAIDEQLPAISKLPPLIACHLTDPNLDQICESAIRVTNNAPRAVDYGRVCAALLTATLRGETPSDALSAAIQVAPDPIKERLQTALGATASVREVSKHFGLHCDLGVGVPSILYNLKTVNNFTDAIRHNIYAGGDNCGRAILLGAVAGARYGIGGDKGIPESWLEQVNGITDIERMIDEILS